MTVHHQIGEVHPADAARFWVWVDKAPGDGCWEWQGEVGSNGYGRWTINGRKHGVHRIALTLSSGPIPDGLVVDHMCHNTACVRPDHLQAVTQKQNSENVLPVRAESGYRGVHRHGRRWRGCVRHARKMHYTRPFDTPEEANEAVIALRNELFTNNLLDRKAS